MYYRLKENIIKKDYSVKNKKSPEGKIRLLYEAIPFAFIFEKAGRFKWL